MTVGWKPVFVYVALKVRPARAELLDLLELLDDERLDDELLDEDDDAGH